jgi:hypothetical protein
MNNRSRRDSRVVVLSVIATLWLTEVALAQAGAGAIMGVVTDESGGAVPGASLKIVNETTGAVVEAFTNWALSLWVRNLLDKNYFELLSAAPGNSGLCVGLPGDPRTVGMTVRVNFR